MLSPVYPGNETAGMVTSPHACMTDLLNTAVTAVRSVLSLSLGTEVGNTLQVVKRTNAPLIP